MAWFGDFIDWYHDNGLLPGLWKGATGQQSNEKINEENLEYQKERNEIEDARYEEETAYNRAFAEEERDYNRAFAENQRDYERALQQQIFEREDTALERQAASLSAMGINPASVQLNGLGAGQAVSASGAPSSVNPPSLSSRGGSALHQDMTGVNSVSALLGLADTMNGLQTGKYQRDSLALQNDAKFLDNLSKANSLGIKYYGLFEPNKHGYIKTLKSDKYTDFLTDKDNGKSLFDTSLFKQGLGSDYKKRYFENMPDWAKTLESIGDNNIYNKATKALTNLSNLADKASTNLFDKENGKTMYELGKSKNGKWNPFELLLNLFN